jgi:hypothetical protein
MSQLDYGQAIYQTIPAAEFSIGAVSYFNTEHEWNLITNIHHMVVGETPGYKKLTKIPWIQISQNIPWGTKCSQSVSLKEANLVRI